MLGPAIKILPDSEIVFSPSASGFDAAQFAAQQDGYLARYKGFVEGTNRAIRGIIDRAFGFRNFGNFRLQVFVECGDI